MNKKPNVLLIEVDQMPWFALGCSGCRNVKTPNLDRLVADGVLFGNATTQSPICLPSRISMLSGKYPTKTRQFGFSGDCSRDIEWIHNTFKKNGYKTGAFGKFHSLSVGQEQWDFDVSAPTLPEENDLSMPRNNNYMNYCKAHGVPWPTDQMHGHDPYNGIRRRPSSSSPNMHYICRQACPSDVPLEHGLERYTAGQCMDFIRECEDPFFVWLTFDRPHSPTALSKGLAETMDPDSLVLDAEIPTLEQLLSFFEWDRNHFLQGESIHVMGEEAFRILLATYFRLIESIDFEIGQVLDLLKEQGRYEDTCIFFTADHGDEAGNLGLYNKHRGCCSEAITRIPFVVKPNFPLLDGKLKETVAPMPVENVDIFPTACAFAGIRPPAGLQGEDLSGYLQGGKSPDLQRPVFCEDYYRRMVKKGEWRLVFDVADDARCQLHNLEKDPKQLDNLYGCEECRGKRIELKRDLLAFLAESLNGGYSEADAERVRLGLDDDSDSLPLHVMNTRGFKGTMLHTFRAAAVIRAEGLDKEVFVPFYPGGKILLFQMEEGVHEQRNNYRKAGDAVAFDGQVVEGLLDRGLRYMMDKVFPVSILHPHKY